MAPDQSYYEYSKCLSKLAARHYWQLSQEFEYSRLPQTYYVQVQTFILATGEAYNHPR